MTHFMFLASTACAGTLLASCLAGLGIWLWKSYWQFRAMNDSLSLIAATMNKVNAELNDHENRIKSLERKGNHRVTDAS